MFGTKSAGCSEQKLTDVRNEKYRMFGTKNAGCSEQKLTDVRNGKIQDVRNRK